MLSGSEHVVHMELVHFIEWIQPFPEYVTTVVYYTVW